MLNIKYVIFRFYMWSFHVALKTSMGIFQYVCIIERVGKKLTDSIVIDWLVF
jgi:hypothetical protein